MKRANYKQLQKLISKGQLTQRPAAGPGTEPIRLECSDANGKSMLCSLLPKLRDCCGRGRRKIVRERSSGRLQENGVFQTQQGSCMYELMVIVRTHARHTQAQARPNPAWRQKLGRTSHLWGYWHLISNRGRVNPP